MNTELNPDMSAPDGYKPTVADRLRGALFGLAAGDALGTTVEFRPRGSFSLMTKIVGGGPFGLKPGEWTDDTSMALCLAQSIVETQTFDPLDQLKRYLKWWKHGHLSSNGICFDIGNQTRNALDEFCRTAQPACGPTDARNSGNGSLMRLAPVAIAFYQQPAEAIRLAAESSRTTHGSILCLDACRYFAGLLVGAFGGAGKQELLSPGYSPAPDMWLRRPLDAQIKAVSLGSWKNKTRDQINASGYVVHTLEAAIWAFANSHNYQQAVLNAVNLGEDADTTGAVCGQLAGAYYGLGGIPRQWLAMLAKLRTIQDICDGLCVFANRPSASQH